MHDHEWKPLKTETEERLAHKHGINPVPSSPEVDWYVQAALGEDVVHVHKMPMPIDLRVSPVTTRGDEPA